MADFTKPALTSTYTNFITELKGRDDDISSLFSSGSTFTGTYPVRAVRWNASNGYFERRNAANNGFERLEGAGGTHKFVNLETGALTATGGASITGNLSATGQVQANNFNVTGTTKPANGLYRPAANEIRLTTGNSDRLTIESTGEVGINTVDPAYTLDITGTFRLRNGSSDSRLEVGTGGTGNRSAYIDLVGDDTYTDYGFRIARANSGANSSTSLIHRGTGNFIIEANEAADMKFITSDDVRMVIHDDGDVVIGTYITPNDRLHIKQAITGGVFIRVENNDGYARFGTDANDSFIDADVHNLRNRAGSSTYLISSSSLFDIKTAAKVNGNLEVTSKIQPSFGNSDTKGIIFPTDIGGGSGDKAYIRYYAESGENTRLLIGIENDADDDLYLSSSLVHTSGAFETGGNCTVNGTCTATSFSGNIAFSNITGTVNAAQLNGLASSASGNRWGVVPFVDASGVLEAGRYLDFHTSDGSTADHAGRIDCTGSAFTFDLPLLPSGSRDLGSSSARWQNLYVNDLKLSNKGGANDVDGTWGDYTIQEGQDNLFIKNNRNGKVYKINWTEVEM